MSGISDFYYSGVIEVGVFAAEYIAERIADEMGIANHNVGRMMGMAETPCGDRNNIESSWVSSFITLNLSYDKGFGYLRNCLKIELKKSYRA